MQDPSDIGDGLGRFPLAGTVVAGPCPDCVRGENEVAKTSPIEFIQQVQAETRKVVWPSRRETIMTAVMVVILTTVLAVFFLATDSVFELIVRGLLSLAK